MIDLFKDLVEKSPSKHESSEDPDDSPYKDSQVGVDALEPMKVP